MGVVRLENPIFGELFTVMLGYITQIMSDTSEISRFWNLSSMYRLVKSWVEKMANVLTVGTATTGRYDNWSLANAHISLEDKLQITTFEILNYSPLYQSW